MADTTSPSSPLDFHPDEATADSILIDLASPEHSLASVARKHNVSLAALALWLTTPAARERMLTIERGAYTHVRMSAALNLNAAVHTFVTILDTFQHAPDAPSSSPPSPPADASSAPRSTDSSAPSAFSFLRVALQRQSLALRAAYHLCRLSRIVPVSDEDLARARALIPPRRTGTTPATIENPVRPVFMTPAPNSAPTPAPIQTADPVSVLLHTRTTAPASLTTAAGAAKAHISAFGPMAGSFTEAAARLEAIATSLGVDLSDIDENTPLPDEFLASLPPDLAAFLAPEPHAASP